ncbi:MAG: hypothetical protein NZM12_09600, partial [Steroidobacteraceae bacterium]|nr:hypothetical protein [Steroidobacteraceae bacterium]MDW8260135.1 kynureninase [Gammaproteobacteria bacterium]
DAVRIVTPSDPAQRGAMLTLALRDSAGLDVAALGDALQRGGIVGDTRGPWLRLTPAPLYNTFTEVWQVADRLGTLLARR